MGNFTARLELPYFIPKDDLLGKQVFDSEIVCVGTVKDWTYSEDGIIKMIVKADDGKKETMLVPFYTIEKVGQFIMLKTKRKEFVQASKDELKSFDQIDQKKIDGLIKNKKPNKT